MSSRLAEERSSGIARPLACGSAPSPQFWGRGGDYGGHPQPPRQGSAPAPPETAPRPPTLGEREQVRGDPRLLAGGCPCAPETAREVWGNTPNPRQGSAPASVETRPCPLSGARTIA